WRNHWWRCGVCTDCFNRDFRLFGSSKLLEAELLPDEYVRATSWIRMQCEWLWNRSRRDWGCGRDRWRSGCSCYAGDCWCLAGCCSGSSWHCWRRLGDRAIRSVL
ncbi:hypothetical protein LTR17_025986, partial [Elasticomyces elasticus]